MDQRLPLTVGEILDMALGFYRRRPWPYLILGTIGTLPWVLVLGFWELIRPDSNRLASAATNEWGWLAVGLAALVGGLLIYPLTTGGLVALCAGDYLGQPLTVAQALRRGLAAIPKLWVTYLCKGLTMWALSIPAGIIMVVAMLPFGLLSNMSGGVAWAVAWGIIFVLLTVAAYAIPLALLSLTTVTTIVENAWNFRAVGRSLSLGGHKFWRFFWLCLTAYVMRFPIQAIPSLAALVYGMGAGDSGKEWLVLVLSALLPAVIYPIMDMVLTVAYFDLRVRKEAWDVESTLLALEAGVPLR